VINLTTLVVDWITMLSRSELQNTQKYTVKTLGRKVGPAIAV